MKKYLFVFSQSFSQFLAYRFQILFQVIQNSIPALVTLVALSYAKSNVINSQSLISYYLLVTFTAPLAFSNIDDYIDEITTSGEVNNFLTKPMSLFKMLYDRSFSEKFLIFIFLLPILLPTLFFVPIEVNSLAAFPLVVIISFTISYTFSFLVGLGCFWVDDFWPFRNLKFVIVQLLGGLVVPYSVFPDWLMKAISYTPFPYLVSWPGRVLLHGVTTLQLMQSLFWLIILFIICHFVQNSAIKYYSHTGS